MHVRTQLDALLIRLSEKPWDSIMAECPDCRWITLKPHGPDHPDYRHVLIKPTTTGFRVVWAGSANLMHLRIHPTAGGGSRRPRVPIDESKREEQRRRVTESWAQARDQYVRHAVKLLGYDPQTLQQTDADELVGHLIRAVRVVRTPSPSKSDKSKQPQTETETGDTDEAKPKQPSEESKRAQSEQIREASDNIAKRALEELGLSIGVDIQDVPEDLGKRLRQLDEEQIEALGLLTEELRRHKARYERVMRETAPTAVSSGLLTGAPVEEEELQEAIAQAWQQARNAAELEAAARRNIAFWNAFDSAGRGVQARYLKGAAEALASLTLKHTGAAVHPAWVQLLGVEGAAQAAAIYLASKVPDIESLTRAIDKTHAEAAMRVPAEVLKRADEETERTRQLIDELRARDALSSAYAGRLATRNTLYRQAVLGQAGGSLAFTAALGDALRRGTYNEDVVVQGVAEPSRLNAIARRMGLKDDEYTIARTHDGQTRLVIKRDAIARVMERSTMEFKADESARRIKRHELTLGEDWRPQGLDPRVTLSEEQRAAIEFALARKRVVWDLKAGIGKSLSAIALGKHLLDTGQVDAVIMMVPSNLRDTMLLEHRKFFGNGIRVAVAGEVAPENRTLVDSQGLGAEGRQRLLREGDEPFLIVGHATIRNDVDAIIDRIRRHNGRVLLVLDEAHQAFTPGQGESSQIMQAMQKISEATNENTYMVAMTGTPIRARVSNAHQIISWVEPTMIPESSFQLAFDGIGLGASAVHQIKEENLNRAIDPIVISEHYQLDVPRRDFQHSAPLSTHQLNELRRIAAAEDTIPAAEREWQRLQAIEDLDPEQNALIQRLRQVVEMEHQREDLQPLRDAGHHPIGIVFSNFMWGVHTIQQAFKPGEVLTYTGEDNGARRNQVRAAVNERAIVPGGRVLFDGGEGVAVRILAGGKVRVRLDDGREITVRPEQNPRSGVKLIVATSAGSTGLNLQGANYIVHYGLPFTEAELKQRNARAFRKGQRFAVHTHTITAEVPKEYLQSYQLAQQRRAMEALKPAGRAWLMDDSGTMLRHTGVYAE
jgi:hypothetical protein